jgi:hypothetical protein
MLTKERGFLKITDQKRGKEKGFAPLQNDPTERDCACAEHIKKKYKNIDIRVLSFWIDTGLEMKIKK